MTSLVFVARPLGIEVHDHIIVGKDGHASLKLLKLIRANHQSTGGLHGSFNGSQQLVCRKGHADRMQAAVGIAGPLLPWPIPAQFEAYAIRIVEVDGFAHSMVDDLIHPDPCCNESLERIRKRRPRGIQDGNVIETGRSCRRWRASETFSRIQPDQVMIGAGRDQGCPRVKALRNLEAENITIERKRPLEIGNLEMDVANSRSRIDRGRFGRAGLIRHVIIILSCPAALMLLG